MKLGYLPCYVGNDIHPFDMIFEESVDVSRCGVEGVDAIVLWGGTDIHPSYYGETAHPTSQVRGQSVPSNRDVEEWYAMQQAVEHNIPIIGVCRGAQFVTAFVGGRLIQNVTGHNGGTHPVVCVTEDGNVTHEVTTCHHQMMYPFDVKHEMLAWMPTPRSGVYQHGGQAKPFDMSLHVEPEVVYYPQVRGLAIQGHPEWMKTTSPFTVWLMDAIKNILQEK